MMNNNENVFLPEFAGTVPGKGWFPFFCFYGTTESYFKQTWKLEDIVAVRQKDAEKIVKGRDSARPVKKQRIQTTKEDKL